MSLFPDEGLPPQADERNSSTFADNMKLPVHRWFRYSAGFSASSAQSVIGAARRHGHTRVLDPFTGSGTTLIAAEDTGVQSAGVESHPFVARIARAKLARRSDPLEYRRLASTILRDAHAADHCPGDYPDLIRKCYRSETLSDLDRLRRAYEVNADDNPIAELCWLTLVSILRRVSHVGTAQWQYVLPSKSKKNAESPFESLRGSGSEILSGHASR